MTQVAARQQHPYFTPVFPVCAFDYSVVKVLTRYVTAKVESELVQKYQDRFIRYEQSLFTFLREDDIPWHNNTAEQAIRHLCVQEKMSGFFYESLMPDYLLLLGIKQTCRVQNKSFFRFLFSGATDLDAFQSQKRK